MHDEVAEHRCGAIQSEAGNNRSNKGSEDIVGRKGVGESHKRCGPSTIGMKAHVTTDAESPRTRREGRGARRTPGKGSDTTGEEGIAESQYRHGSSKIVMKANQRRDAETSTTKREGRGAQRSGEAACNERVMIAKIIALKQRGRELEAEIAVVAKRAAR